MSSVSFALADSFLDSLIQIPKSKQKKVATFIEKFRQDPRQSGINYEKIIAANDPNFRSVRIDRDYRGIVLKPETGSVFIMLVVARHDDAYAWASRHSCRVHPNTGTIQLIKSQNISKAPALENHEAEEVFESEPTISGETSLRFSMSDNQLSSIGVPQELIDNTRQISSVEQFVLMPRFI